MKKKKLVCLTMGMLFAMPSAVMGANTVYELAPIVVTANRVEKKIIDTNEDISVVSRKDIEEHHLGTVEEVLRTVPGMQFLNYGLNGTNSNLSGVRIDGSKDIVVLVDGVRITDFQGANNSGYMYSSVLSNIDGIERVEVLRSGGAVLYGSSARGGVINIITRNPKTVKSSMDISFGEGAKRDFRFNSGGRIGESKLSYNAFVRKAENGDITDGSGKLWPGHKALYSEGLKVAYDVNKKHNFFVNYERMKGNWYTRDYVYKNVGTGQYNNESWTFQDTMDWDHISNRFTFRRTKIGGTYLQVYWDGHPPYIPPTNDFKYTFFNDQVTFQDTRNELVMGVEYSKGVSNKPILIRIDYDEDGNRILTYGYPKEENLGFYLHEEWKAAPRLTLSAGVRHDRPKPDEYSGKYENHNSKSYKISWDFTDKDTLYAGHEDYFILPGLNDRFAPQFGNPELKPAYGYTRSVGYSHEFSDRGGVTFRWFHTKAEQTIGIHGHYENKKNPKTGKKEKKWVWDNQNSNGYGYNRGWNLQFLYRLGSLWDLNLGWAHLRAENSGDTYSQGYSPKNQFTFRVTYNIKKFTAGLDGFYFDRRVHPDHANEQGWPDNKYTIYNLSFNYAPNKNTTFYMKVDNLFDTLWAEHTDVIWNHKPESWYSMPGRVISIGMNQRF